MKGVDTILIPEQIDNKFDFIKTSFLFLHKIPICRTWNLKMSLQFLKDSGLQIVSCTENTDKYIYKPDFTNPRAIIMGSEEDGISPEFLKMSDSPKCKNSYER